MTAIQITGVPPLDRSIRYGRRPMQCTQAHSYGADSRLKVPTISCDKPLPLRCFIAVIRILVDSTSRTNDHSQWLGRPIHSHRPASGPLPTTIKVSLAAAAISHRGQLYAGYAMVSELQRAIWSTLRGIASGRGSGMASERDAEGLA
jgi:hypothetical protein